MSEHMETAISLIDNLKQNLKTVDFNKHPNIIFIKRFKDELIANGVSQDIVDYAYHMKVEIAAEVDESVVIYLARELAAIMAYVFHELGDEDIIKHIMCNISLDFDS